MTLSEHNSDCCKAYTHDHTLSPLMIATLGVSGADEKVQPKLVGADSRAVSRAAAPFTVTSSGRSDRRARAYDLEHASPFLGSKQGCNTRMAKGKEAGGCQEPTLGLTSGLSMAHSLGDGCTILTPIRLSRQGAVVNKVRSGASPTQGSQSGLDWRLQPEENSGGAVESLYEHSPNRSGTLLRTQSPAPLPHVHSYPGVAS